jgi:hypothetical protein
VHFAPVPLRIYALSDPKHGVSQAYKLRFISIEVRPCHCGRCRLAVASRGGGGETQVQTAFALPYDAARCPLSCRRKLVGPATVERSEGGHAHVAASVVLVSSSTRRRCRVWCHLVRELGRMRPSALAKRAGERDGDGIQPSLPGRCARDVRRESRSVDRCGRTFDRRLYNCSCRLNDI